MLTKMSRRKVYPQQDLADRVRTALSEAKVSQAELARACGVTDQAVHDWITTGRIGKQHLVTICYLTKKPWDYFLVNLKTWRRVAALAPMTLLAARIVESALCVLCQIVKITRRDYFLAAGVSA